MLEENNNYCMLLKLEKIVFTLFGSGNNAAVEIILLLMNNCWKNQVTV